MRCVLFIFGKKRKQLLRWIDVSKLLNADLLKAIVEYDPTTIQKKKKFTMIEKELKSKLLPYIIVCYYHLLYHIL